ncbi:hypothetical protein CAOG_06938 [Capsaspora owczarzaki ATCC 30864]|uniref:Presequence translocated-associated motor subunit PAM16 n=1 Tax=Capsaspora owczarzaki (strain ATCC 30864) TaxID=595528 RepID=A0A0D2VY83_CAPO3|nr:hypothetical protein CAOG_06938 [Capsaspora owczarzaki ATCC 30864]KJE96647.1 hypothetical protein CAOG_006938 [Capsaspora owczarzaki ATCC 30864]|eukprot:XP_004343662.1 hypothetical protein CAOG_06938 [Capsaspora owczarzaki ATCC 30864]
MGIGNLGRVAAVLLFQTVRITGRAVLDAWQHTAAFNAAQRAARATSRNVAKDANMTINEARQILNVNPSTPPDQIQATYEKMFNLNNTPHTFYIQSKIFRAKERLDAEIAARPTPQA